MKAVCSTPLGPSVPAPNAKEVLLWNTTLVLWRLMYLYSVDHLSSSAFKPRTRFESRGTGVVLVTLWTLLTHTKSALVPVPKPATKRSLYSQLLCNKDVWFLMMCPPLLSELSFQVRDSASSCQGHGEAKYQGRHCRAQTQSSLLG